MMAFIILSCIYFLVLSVLHYPHIFFFFNFEAFFLSPIQFWIKIADAMHAIFPVALF